MQFTPRSLIKHFTCATHVPRPTVLVFLMSLMLALLANSTSASTIVIKDKPSCEAANFVWQAPGGCVVTPNYTIQANDEIRVQPSDDDNGTSLVVPASTVFTINGTLTITSFMANLDNGGTVTVNTSGLLQLTGNGQLYSRNGATFNNQGTLNADQFSIVVFRGTVTNSGTMNLGGQIQNYTKLSNMFTAKIAIANNTSLIQTSAASVDNSGTITIQSGAKLLISNGEVKNESNCNIMIETGGNLSNAQGSTITNYGFIGNDGTISNAGTLVNNTNATIRNAYLVLPSRTATFTNTASGTVSNAGGRIHNNVTGKIVNNSDSFYMGGIMTNQDTISNGGRLTIVQGATLRNQTTIDNAGSIINSGTLCGPGTVTGNPVNPPQIPICPN